MAYRESNSTLLQAGASESEDDLATAAAQGPRKVTKSKATTQKMTAAKTATKRKAAARQPRQALKDRTNIPSDAEDVEDDDESANVRPKRAKTAPARKARGKAAETMAVIPETQQDPADIEQSIEMDVDEADATVVPAPQPVQRVVPRARSTSVQPVQPLLPRASARSASAQPMFPPPRERERSGSVSGTERERRGGDPETRRKLNDLTKKYDNLNLKYQNLQEIGKNNADSNFEKLKRASDEKAKDANALIAALKKEIAELRKPSAPSPTAAAETAGLQKQVASLTTANEKLSTESATLKEKLQTSQNEVKSLEAKLVAARQQVSNASTQENGKTPSQSGLRSSVSANAKETDAQKEAKMKENLYSDLTGLIIRGVKRKEGEDQYDCIQTGRNGTLHFHLSVANDAAIANPKTPTGLSYEEAEFAYEPFLDESRDKELLDILPDYLAEEICFPRNHAVKFYTKVVESMTRRIVVEE